MHIWLVFWFYCLTGYFELSIIIVFALACLVYNIEKTVYWNKTLYITLIWIHSISILFLTTSSWHASIFEFIFALLTLRFTVKNYKKWNNTKY